MNDKAIVRTRMEPITYTERLDFTNKYIINKQEQDALKAWMDSQKAAYKAKQKELENDAGTMGEILTTGKIGRIYQCKCTLNHTTKQREYFDIDTGELIDTDPFTQYDYNTLRMEGLEPIAEGNDDTDEG